MLKFNSTLSH